MADLNVETTEPDPSASLSNDQTMNKNVSDPSAPTKGGDAASTPQGQENNGTEDAVKNKKEDKVQEVKKNGDAMGSKVETEDQKILRTRARLQEDPRKNSKYDPSVLPTTDDPGKIRAQVEFYFGDTNLPTDEYMWLLTGGSMNKPVKIADICNFGRMKRFQPISAVVAALRESDFLEVTGPEGLEEVKRKSPYDSNQSRSKNESRSVYVKGFGDEEPTTQFDIEAFFTPYGPTNAVRLRRTPEKLFKGSVFVEFQDDETAQKFLALDPKPKWKGKHELKIQSKREYISEKTQGIKDGMVEPNETRGFYAGRGGYKGRGRGGNRGGERHEYKGGRDRSDRDPDDWKKRREDDQKSGFKPRRGDHRGNHRSGRGGRGRNGHDSRGPRSDDRNREREKTNGTKLESGVGEIKNAVIDDRAEKNEKKRAREDDGGADDTPAKKADTKPKVSAEAS